MLQPSRGELDRAFRRQLGQPVDFARGGAEMLDKSGTIRGEAAEHKAPIGVHSRNLSQVQVQLTLAITLEKGESDKLTVVAECPAVIWAAKCRRITLGVIANLVAAVCAAVEQQMQFSVTITGHDHVL